MARATRNARRSRLNAGVSRARGPTREKVRGGPSYFAFRACDGYTRVDAMRSAGGARARATRRSSSRCSAGATSLCRAPGVRWKVEVSWIARLIFCCYFLVVFHTSIACEFHLAVQTSLIRRAAFHTVPDLPWYSCTVLTFPVVQYRLLKKPNDSGLFTTSFPQWPRLLQQHRWT